MSKNEVALQLCLSIIKDEEPDPNTEIEELGKHIADVYNSIYRTLDI